VKSFRAGGVELAVWRNETERNGEVVVSYSVTAEKRYRDRENNWRSSDCYFANDLPRLRLLLDKAFEFIVLKESEPDAAETRNGANDRETASPPAEA
jgi:hypothetical protein